MDWKIDLGNTLMPLCLISARALNFGISHEIFWMGAAMMGGSSYIKPKYFYRWLQYYNKKGCCGRDRMEVGFTTTYAICAYHNWCCEFESRSRRGVHHYVIKFVSDLRQVGGFLRVLQFSPQIKLTATI